MTAVDEAGGREALEAAGKGNGVDEHRVSSESPGRDADRCRAFSVESARGQQIQAGRGGSHSKKKRTLPGGGNGITTYALAQLPIPSPRS